MPNPKLAKNSCIPYCLALRTAWIVKEIRQPWRRCKNHRRTYLTIEHTCPQRITQSYVSGETPWRILPQDPLLNIHKLPSGARVKVSMAPTSFFPLVPRPSHFLKGHTVTSISGMLSLQQSTCCSQSHTAGVDQHLMQQLLLRAELSGLCVWKW